jgi:hypothetical protein
MTTTNRRSGGLAALLTAAAIGLAACSGSSSALASEGTSSPTVASLPTSTSRGTSSGTGGGGTTTTTLQNGDPTRLLDGWADCMRSHGDPGQADPTIDANKDIDIEWNPAITGGIFGTNKGGQGNSGPGQYCRAYLDAAQKALGGDHQPSGADQATLEKYSECMRANGIPDFPDPINGTLSFNLGAGGDLNPNNPTFRNTSKLCARKTGAHVPTADGPPPPGTIRIVGASPPGAAGASANG